VRVSVTTVQCPKCDLETILVLPIDSATEEDWQEFNGRIHIFREAHHNHGTVTISETRRWP
jgi:hypothetical protein